MRRLLGRRRRRDELTPLEAQIARDHLPIPGGEPVPAWRRSAVVLRHKAAIITAAVIVGASGLAGGGVFVGSWWEDHREDAALEKRIDHAEEQRTRQLTALGALHFAELERRGILSAEDEDLFGTLDVMAANPPREAATLRAQENWQDADDELDALLAQQD